MPNVEKDFVELLKLFNKHEVRYAIVGAFAVGFHAISRYTKDLDILVDSTLENGERIVAALNEFGFSSLSLKASDFLKEGRFVQLGYEPVRVDLITSIAGPSFDQVWKNKKMGELGSTPTYFIGLKELIKAKQTAHRKQDLADLELLAKAAKMRKKR